MYLQNTTVCIVAGALSAAYPLLEHSMECGAYVYAYMYIYICIYIYMYINK